MIRRTDAHFEWNRLQRGSSVLSNLSVMLRPSMKPYIVHSWMKRLQKEHR